MTIKELKLILEQYPEDMQVLISGYECGYESLDKECIGIVKVSDHGKEMDNSECGRFRDKSWDMDHKEYLKIRGLVLGRYEYKGEKEI